MLATDLGTVEKKQKYIASMIVSKLDVIVSCLRNAQKQGICQLNGHSHGLLVVSGLP